ncbi:MAG: hypothetical protein WC244_04300 [Patescibacteria group bacterium]|jgi:hypothetical protein
MDNTSTTNLTDKQLKFSYWYITHKLSLRKAWKIILAVIAGLVWLYVIWQLVVFVITYQSIQQSVQAMLFTSDASLPAIEQIAPRQLAISEMTVMNAGEKYDYLVQASNPNNNWLTQFKYRFTTPSSTENDFRNGFVLPGESKYLMDLSKTSSQANLEMKDLSLLKVENFALTQNKMMRFVVDSVDIAKASKSTDPTKVSFTIKNDSAYSYWEVDLQILLMNGGSISGINHIVLNSFKSGENRKVEIFWNNPISNADSVNVIPNLNILDSDNLMSPS